MKTRLESRASALLPEPEKYKRKKYTKRFLSRLGDFAIEKLGADNSALVTDEAGSMATELPQAPRI